MNRMKQLNICSPEALDAATSDVVRLKIKLTEATAKKDAEVAKIEKEFTTRTRPLVDDIATGEGHVQAYCLAHRVALFPDKKSRETSLAVIGFELTPPRVETTSRKITWRDVIGRLARLVWGAAYLTIPEPKLDKQALLADRELLTAEQCHAAGIRFAQDEQFFLRPKPLTATALDN